LRPHALTTPLALRIQDYRNKLRQYLEFGSYLTGNTLVSATKPNWLMLLRETADVYCENHMEHTDTLCRQNAEILTLTVGGT
jgi:hypothetical protein